jgi:hypothetical protein
VDGSLMDATTPRRDFLKYLGFSTAAATLASCKMPVRKAIPYVNRPEHVVPGLAKYYATTFVSDGYVLPIVAKVREGRPIKIEGNALCSYTQGGTSPRAKLRCWTSTIPSALRTRRSAPAMGNSRKYLHTTRQTSWWAMPGRLRWPSRWCY